jgi:hypothetical protein
MKKVCHYTFSKTGNHANVFNDLQKESLKKAQTCASYFLAGKSVFLGFHPRCPEQYQTKFPWNVLPGDFALAGL